MEAKKSQPKSSTAQADESRGPSKVIRINDVSASIFAREHNGNTYYSVSFSRSYKDANGTFRYAKSFDAEDLPRVLEVAKQAYDFLQGVKRSA